MKSEDETADDICHSDHATEGSTNAKHKATQHGGLHYRFWHELTFLQKLFSITNGEVLFFFFTEMESEDGIADEPCHSDQAIDTSTNATHKAIHHGGVYYRFGHRVISFTKIIQYS
jgi:hypothetical protein